MQIILNCLLQTHYTGLLFDWCRPMSSAEQPISLFKKMLRYITTLTFFGLNTFSQGITIFLAVVTPGIPNNVSLHEKVYVWSINSLSMFTSFVMHANMFLNHRKLLTFFKDFKFDLSELNTSFISSISIRKSGFKRPIILIYILYIFTVVGLTSFDFTTALYNCINSEEAKSAPSDAISKPHSILGISYRIINLFLKTMDIVSFLFGCMADILPAFIYYNSATVVETLTQQWVNLTSLISTDEGKNQLEDGVIEKETRRISQLYDSLVKLVFRADHLVGPIVILNQGLTFIVVCAITSFLVNNTNRNDTLLVVYLILSVFRLVWPILLASKLNTSASRLRAAVLSFQSKSHYKDFLYQERKAVRYFLDQLQSDQLAACPSGLYKITPSMLLVMLNLVVTYTIILLQSG